jgi:AcrR family transcriptional regulator
VQSSAEDNHGVHPEDVKRLHPGRPRDEERGRAIEAAAIELLVEDGYSGMTIDGVAARAGVGKATIYRRWDTKEDLVVDAFLQRCRDHVVSPDTGTLRGDLLQLYRALLAKFRRDGLATQAFVAEQHRHPELAATFRAAFLNERRAAMREVLERGVARGELPAQADLDLLGDVGSALMWHRLTISGAPLDDGLPERIVEQFFPTPPAGGLPSL